jgi:hypothetical protein
MRKRIILFAFALLGLAFCSAGANQGQVQSHSSAPVIVLQSMIITHEIIDTTRSELFVRVWSDKRIQYQKFDGDSTLVTAIISDDQLLSLQQRLNAIDTTKIKERTKPYHTYEHYSAEWRIQIQSRGSGFNFTVINPWPEGVPGPKLRWGKHLPKEVRAIICECSRLRSQVSHEPMDPFCDSAHAPSSKEK